MDKESANWCRIAQAIMQKGAEVLRQFLLLEILTQSFNINSQFWTKDVLNPAKINNLNLLINTKLKPTLNKSPDNGNSILNNLLQSWRSVSGSQMAIGEQLERLKQWKNDIENEDKTLISSSVNEILMSWLKDIEQESKEMEKVWMFVSKFNGTFHKHLKTSQSSLLLEIEKNDGFLSRCSQKLKSLSMPSRSEFQQLVQNFKTELNSWKGKCRKIFQGFDNKYRNIITKGLTEATTVPSSYGMEKFFLKVQTDIRNCNLESQVDKFFSKWDDNLHKEFDKYEMEILEYDSPEAILRLIQRLRDNLEKRSSFKDTKILFFFSSFNPPALPRQLQSQISILRQTSRSSQLNEYDITKLLIALRHGNLVHSPPKDWDDDQHDWDTSITADVRRLRVHRNTIAAHIDKLRIPNERFEELWRDLTKLLRMVASRCGDQFSMNIGWEIDKMKDCSLEPDREYELQREFLTWCKKDILAQLSARSSAAPQCLDMLESIQTALEKLARRRQACTCRICNNDFYTESELAEHMRLHQDCRCLSCKKTFSQGSDLTNHMKCHQDRACRICKMPCSTEWEFRRHMWCNQDCRCPGCDEAFQSENVFEEHITYHKALKCNICKKGYPTESEFCHHMLCHQARTCLSCRKDFPNENEFEQHIRSHEARTCRSCKKNFSTPIELDNHMKCHQDRTCCSCNMDFSTEIELEVHREYHQVRTCRDCVKEFSTVTELEEHMKYHQGPASAVSSVSKSNDRDQDQTAEEEEPRKNGQKKKRHSLDST